jgi:hypothetical protein
MKKFCFIILLFSFVCLKDQAYCANHKKHDKEHAHHKKHGKKMNGIAQQISFLRLEIEEMEKGKAKENIKKITSWLENLEAKLLSKLKKVEAKIEKYRSKLNETQDEAISAEVIEKIRSSENKIDECQELLKSLEELKTRLLSKNEAEAQ